MILEELTINGFKSFAKKSSLEFSAAVTAIVGPNGSGKSNVAESFRFVLGEQSVKSLRGKRGEDLIWGGSEQVSRGNRATVSLTLNNTSRLFGIDYDSIKIERVVNRDGQNEYFLNGSAVRLKDIQELLAAANIGSTGHHIISQGEADRILAATPRERREMIEDALGLKVYLYKKQEAEKKLEKTLENIAQAESLRREHAPHLKYLKKQVERIEKALTLQNELKTVYLEYLKREDVYLAFHTDRLNISRQAPAKQLVTLQEQLVAAKTLLLKHERERDTETEPLRQVESALAAVRQTKAELLRKLGAVEGELAYIKKRLATPNLTDTNKTAVISVASLTELVTSLEREVNVALAKAEESYLRRALTDLVTRLKLFLQRGETKTVSASDTLQTELAEGEAKQADWQKRLASIEAEEAAAKEKWEEVQARLNNRATADRDAERQVYQLIGDIHQLEVELEGIDRELHLLARDREEFKRELQEAVVLIQSAAARYFDYEVLENGVAVGVETIVAEDRDKQRERRHELEKLKIRLEELGTGNTKGVLEEYNTAVARDAFLEHEISDLDTAVKNLEGLIAELNEQLQAQFANGITKINTEFNHFFVLMFGGGSASLRLVKSDKKTSAADSDDDVDTEASVLEGVEVEINLPNKRIKGLNMLSGGERALTSIALIFAMSQINPPPFIILDETDAALDEANSRRYGDMIEALAKRSQLILITHNRETMSRAGILYGVTMGSDGVSKLLSVKFDEAAQVAK